MSTKEHDACPVAVTASLLSDENTILVVRDLLEGPKRFCEIGKADDGSMHMSTRTLTKKLKELEEQKIITRTKYNESPPRVEYELTALGLQLDTIIQAMREYGKLFVQR